MCRMGKNRQINASDATSWLKCRRRAWYDLHPLPDVEPIVDPFADLIAQVGIEHELHRYILGFSIV